MKISKLYKNTYNHQLANESDIVSLIKLKSRLAKVVIKPQNITFK